MNDSINPRTERPQELQESSKRKKKIYFSKRQKALFYLLYLSIFGFSYYLYREYQDLRKNFLTPAHYIPTRIYSDVTLITRSIPRKKIMSRLQSLGYIDRKGRALTEDGSILSQKVQESLNQFLESQTEKNQFRFRLHRIHYPKELIPEEHPTLSLEGKDITLVFDGHGEDALLVSMYSENREIEEIYLEPEIVATLSGDQTEIREVVPFAQIPAHVWQAIISVEDQHYLDHKGFDPRGIIRALWVNIKTLSLSQGGSTLTQQLVKNLTARKGKNIPKKIAEFFLAILLEFEFEKEAILERYLNEIYLGQIGNYEVHGVSEGAKYYFSKNLSELNLAETAILAGLIRGPWYYNPYRHRDRAIERQQWVLKKMVETGQIAQEQAEIAKTTEIEFTPPPTSTNKAPYFNDYVKAKLIDKMKDRFSEQELGQAGLQVYTTLDIEMNEAAQNAVFKGINKLEKRLESATIRLEGALASIDHKNGYLKALVGGKSYQESTFNRILNSKRQVGSTFKPIVYAAFLETEIDQNGVPIGPGYPVIDEPVTISYDENRQQWSPDNYEKTFKGKITLREALAHSVNTVAAKIGQRAGIDRIIELAHMLGIHSELPAVPSLALGVAELSPIELLQVYATIANQGFTRPPIAIRAITQSSGELIEKYASFPKPALDSAIAALLKDLLTTVVESGTARSASLLGFNRPAAGKTGTTSQHRDAWFAGLTPQLTTVVWVGFDEGVSKKLKLTGGGSALPIWVDYMNETLEGIPPEPFEINEDLITVPISKKSGRLIDSSCNSELIIMEKYIKTYIHGMEPLSCDAEEYQ